jgi:hypothetical protein
MAGAALEACAQPTTSLAPPPSASVAPPPSASPPGAVVLRNATVLTMDPNRRTADAVAIAGDTITAVGTEAEVLAAAGSTATIVDVGGRILMPGFNDAHCHRIGDRDISGYASAEAAIEDALAGGWTSISELFVSQERLDELRALDEANALRLRVNCYLPVNYLDDKFGVWFGAYEPHQTFSPNLRIGGVKVFADSAWTNQMYMTEPHTDRPDYLGDVYWTRDELHDMVRSLHDDGWQVSTHTCGDAAHDLVLDAYEAALAGASNADHRHRIEHVMAVRDDQVQRMRDLSILASFQLSWFTPDTTPDVEGTLGPERVAWVGRWRDLLEAGVPTVASTDHPYDDVTDEHATGGRPMKALSVATTRMAAPGQAPEPWQAAQTISVDQGLELMTRAGAYSTHEEDQKGTISPGKLADLVVLSDDPRGVSSEGLGDVHALMTMIGGQVEYQDPGSTHFDAIARGRPSELGRRTA